MELVDGVEGVSVAKQMVNVVMERAWWSMRLREVWLPLEADVNLMRAVQAKIMKVDKDKERTRKMELGRI